MFKLKSTIFEIFDHNLLEIGDELSTVIYCDLDGVLADFENSFKKISGGFPPSDFDKKGNADQIWSLVSQQPNNGIEWWSNLDKMEDADILWKFIKSLKLSVKILSSTSSRTSKSNSAEIGKRKWVITHLNPVPKDDDVILVDSADAKKVYAKGPNYILIDDYLKNINQWRSAGGTGIHHISATDTIEQLKRVLGIQSESYGYSWSNV